MNYLCRLLIFGSRFTPIRHFNGGDAAVFVLIFLAFSRCRFVRVVHVTNNNLSKVEGQFLNLLLVLSNLDERHFP